MCYYCTLGILSCFRTRSMFYWSRRILLISAERRKRRSRWGKASCQKASQIAFVSSWMWCFPLYAHSLAAVSYKNSALLRNLRIKPALRWRQPKMPSATSTLHSVTHTYKLVYTPIPMCAHQKAICQEATVSNGYICYFMFCHPFPIVSQVQNIIDDHNACIGRLSPSIEEV